MTLWELERLFPFVIKDCLVESGARGQDQYLSPPSEWLARRTEQW